MQHRGASNEERAHRRGARSILVVDDDTLFLASLGRMLERIGLEPLCVETIDEALASLERRAFDLVLLDLEFPRRSGIVLLKALQARVGQPPPVVVMSGAASFDDLIEVLRRGAVDYLRKPFPPEELSAALDRALARRGCGCCALPVRPERAEPAPAPAAAAGDVERLIRGRIDGRCAAAGLSTREREVLDLVLLGRSLSEVGTALGITPRTAKFHLSNVLAKLGAESRADLVRVFL